MSFRPRRLLPPVLLAAAVIAAAPFLGVLRDALLAAFPRRALLVVTALVAAVALAALAWAIGRIRERRALRWGGLAACAVLVAAQVVGFATGNASVDVVERIHIVEYGLLAALFYRAFLPLGGAAAPLLAWVAAGLVGTLDEWVQWLVPTRVGDVGDVALNFAAAGTGTLFALCVAPPSPGGGGLLPEPPRRALAALAAVAVLALAGLWHVAHLGYAIRDEALQVTFLSSYTAEQLPRVAAERARRWQTDPPTLHPLAREDRYFTEGTWRVAHRNAHFHAGRLLAAWREQLVLERYYAPVLARRGLASGAPLDLATHDRARLARAGMRRPDARYESPVLADRIALWPSKRQLWVGAGALAAGLLAVAWRTGDRARGGVAAASFSPE